MKDKIKKIQSVMNKHLEEGNIKKVKKDIKHISVKTVYNTFGYRVIFDKLKNLKVELNIYKGRTIAGREFQETDNTEKKLRMIRLKIRFENNLINLIEPIDNIKAREIIEDIDIDFSLIEKFFLKEYGKYLTRKIISPIRDLLDDDKTFKEGDKLITLRLLYEDFIKLTQFLSLLINDFQNKNVNI